MPKRIYCLKVLKIQTIKQKYIFQRKYHSNFLFHSDQCYGNDILIFQNIIQFPITSYNRNKKNIRKKKDENINKKIYNIK